MLFIRKDNMHHGQMSIQILLKQLYQYLNAHHRSLERNDLTWIIMHGLIVVDMVNNDLYYCRISY